MCQVLCRVCCGIPTLSLQRSCHIHIQMGSEAQRNKATCPASHSLWVWLHPTTPWYSSVSGTIRDKISGFAVFSWSTSTSPHSVFARQPISSPYQRVIPSPAQAELQKSWHLTFLTSDTGPGRRRLLRNDGSKRREFPSLPDGSPVTRRLRVSAKAPATQWQSCTCGCERWKWHLTTDAVIWLKRLIRAEIWKGRTR